MQAAPMFQNEEQWIEYLKQMPMDNPPFQRSRRAVVLLNIAGKEKFELVRFIYDDDSRLNAVHYIYILPQKLELEQARQTNNAPFCVTIGNYQWIFDEMPRETPDIWKYIIQIQPVTAAEIISYILQENSDKRGWLGI